MAETYIVANLSSFTRTGAPSLSLSHLRPHPDPSLSLSRLRPPSRPISLASPPVVSLACVVRLCPRRRSRLAAYCLHLAIAGKKKGATVMKNGEVLQLLVNGEKVVRRSSSYQDSESAAFAGKIRVSGDEMGPDLSLLVNKEGC